MDLIDPLPPEKDREIKGDFQASATILKETLVRVRHRCGHHERRARAGGHALRASARAGRARGEDCRAEQQHRAGDEGGERAHPGADSRQRRRRHRGAEPEDHAGLPARGPGERRVAGRQGGPAAGAGQGRRRARDRGRPCGDAPHADRRRDRFRKNRLHEFRSSPDC